VRVAKTPTSHFCNRIDGVHALLAFEIARWALDETSNPRSCFLATGETEVLGAGIVHDEGDFGFKTVSTGFGDRVADFHADTSPFVCEPLLEQCDEPALRANTQALAVLRTCILVLKSLTFDSAENTGSDRLKASNLGFLILSRKRALKRNA
jgi:hypothetical protein